MSNLISIPRGDDRQPTFEIVDVNGDPVPLTGAKVYLYVLENLEDDVGDALITKENTAAGGSDDQIELDSPESLGTGIIKFDKVDTVGHDPKQYRFKLKFDIGGLLTTAVKDGTFDLTP